MDAFSKALITNKIFERFIRMRWNKEVNKVMECFIEVSRFMKQGNLSEVTGKECLENGEIETCSNPRNTV